MSDAAVIAERIADLQAFDSVRYAQKACSNLAILDRMRRRGVTVDAVSAGEIQRAIAAGFAARDAKVILTGREEETLALAAAARRR